MVLRRRRGGFPLEDVLRTVYWFGVRHYIRRQELQLAATRSEPEQTRSGRDQSYRTATQTIHHSAEMPSHVVLPVQP